MKTIIKSILVLTIAFGAVAFTNTIKKVDILESSIKWTGKKSTRITHWNYSIKRRVSRDGWQRTYRWYVCRRYDND
jgi:hypothetical protein